MSFVVEKDSGLIPQILSKILDSSVNGITLADPDQEDMPIVYANKSFETMTGYSQGDIIGHNCRFLQGKESVSPFFAKPDGTSQSPSGAKNWRQPCLRRPALVLRPPRLKTPLRFASRHGYHNDSTPVRFPYVLSPPAMEPQTSTKHPGLRLRGGRRTSLLCAPFPVLLHREQEARFQLRKAIDNCQPIEVTLRNYKKNGELFYNHLALTPLFDSKGNLIYYLGVQYDVTQQVKAEEEIKRLGETLEKMTIGAAKS